MKKNLLTGAVALIGLTLTVSSCGDDSSSIGAGMGRISPEVKVDTDIVTSSTPSRAGEDDALPSVSDLKLKLTSEDGTYSKVWDSVDEFDSTQDFKTGTYTLEAYYGSADDAEGKAKPYFYGKQTLEVKYDRTTSVALSARMENSRVRIAYTDAFRDYMTSYTAQLHTPAGNYIDVASAETDPIYVTTGMVNVNLTFTKPNGTSATIEAARFTAKPKTEHLVTLDVNNGDAGGDASLVVTFDDTVDEEDVTIDLSDDILNAPAPEIAAEGFTDNQNFDIVEGMAAPAPVKVNVTARGKIGSVMLSTDSHTLAEAGWPATLDLAALDASMVARLQSLGLSAHGIWKNPDVMGVVDFTGVFSHLRVSAGQEESVNKFTLEVKDRYGKLSEKLTFTVTVDKGEVYITSADSKIGSNRVNATVEYNGDNLASDVSFQIRDDLGFGTWNDMTLVSASRIKSRSVPTVTYNIVLESPITMEQEMTIRAVYGGLHTEATVGIDMPEFTLSCPAEDQYATHALLTVDCDEADAATVARFISKVSNGEHDLDFTVNGNQLNVTGLTPATAVTLTATAGSRSVTLPEFTTEAIVQLPNADMETWHRVNGATSNWWVEYPGADENAVWGTLNLLTTSEGGRTTSALSSNRDGCSYNAFSCVRQAQPGYNSTSAAIISTVGWGKGNSAVGLVSNGNPKYLTVGELYLGKYNPDTKSPDYTGYACESRPTALEFYYKYSAKNSSDYGYVEVKLFDAAGNVIGSGSFEAHSASDYILATVPVTYTAKAKAAKIQVVFKSSGNPACQTVTSDNLSAPNFGNTSNGRFTGSEMTVDDITLKY